MKKLLTITGIAALAIGAVSIFLTVWAERTGPKRSWQLGSPSAKKRALISLIAALLFHTAINYWSWIVPVIPNGGSLRSFELVTGFMVVVAGVLLLCSTPYPSTIAEPT